jgi:hypothetical protein
MHVLIVNFNLNGITEAQFAGQCEQLAPTFAAVPGLVSKIWLADSASGTYGGVYVWQDREALERYKASDLFKGIAANPNLKNVTAREFGVLEAPTQITRGMLVAHA